MNNLFKKSLSFLLLLSILLTSVMSVSFADTASEIEATYGDVNNDGNFNAEDALLVLKHAAKLEMISEKNIKAADVDGNDKIDATDALEILKYAASLIDRFPCESQATPEATVSASPTEATESPSPEPTATVSPEPTATESPEPTATATPAPTATATPRPVISPTPTATPVPDVEWPDDFSGKVWIMGDSIAAKHEKTASVRPLYGWGELIGEYFKPGVVFDNNAISSQSTSSYYTLQKTTYNYVFSKMKENDYVIISYGHNDHNEAKLNGFDRRTDPEASTDTPNSYKWWLKNYYIDPALERGATPILMSSVVRCRYRNKNTEFYEDDIHMKYGVAMEELVAEYAEQGIKIYYIDAQDYTYNLYSSITSDEARLFHGQYGGEASNYFDNTHYSEAGARMIIEYMISEIKKTDLSIKDYII